MALVTHHIDCEFWFEQYPWECSCGKLERMSYLEWIERRRRTALWFWEA